MGSFEEKLTRKRRTTFLYACLKVSKPKSKKNSRIEWKIFQKQKRKKHMKKTSFRKVLRKMPVSKLFDVAERQT